MFAPCGSSCEPRICMSVRKGQPYFWRNRRYAERFHWVIHYVTEHVNIGDYVRWNRVGWKRRFYTSLSDDIILSSMVVNWLILNSERNIYRKYPSCAFTRPLPWSPPLSTVTVSNELHAFVGVFYIIRLFILVYYCICGHHC